MHERFDGVARVVPPVPQPTSSTRCPDSTACASSASMGRNISSSRPRRSTQALPALPFQISAWEMGVAVMSLPFVVCTHAIMPLRHRS
jgi:hypothetical protein